MVRTVGGAGVIQFPWNIYYRFGHGVAAKHWDSGVYADHSLTKLQNFESWRGFNADVHEVFPQRDSWSTLLDDWWNIRARPGQKLSVAMPLWPDNATVNTSPGSNWTTFTNLLEDGDIVRLGWEMNLPSWHHAITSSNRTAWVSAYKNAHAAIKAANPNVLVCLNLNEGPSQASGVSNTQIIDDLAGYFDILAVDFYWWYGVADTDSSWSDRITRDGGLEWHLNKAKSLGVKLSVPEWGIASTATEGTGDKAFFIDKMVRWFADNAADVHHESYFNDDTNSDGHYIYPTTLNPVAAAAYKSDYSTFHTGV